MPRRVSTRWPSSVAQTLSPMPLECELFRGLKNFLNHLSDNQKGFQTCSTMYSAHKGAVTVGAVLTRYPDDCRWLSLSAE